MLGARRLADLCRHLEDAEGSAETLLTQAEDEYLRVRVDLQAARPPS
jgi:hypothetical protein